jgi:hypothetical protein
LFVSSFLILFVVLLVAWILGWSVFQVAGGLIHIRWSSRPFSWSFILYVAAHGASDAGRSAKKDFCSTMRRLRLRSIRLDEHSHRHPRVNAGMGREKLVLRLQWREPLDR